MRYILALQWYGYTLNYIPGKDKCVGTLPQPDASYLIPGGCRNFLMYSDLFR